MKGATGVYDPIAFTYYTDDTTSGYVVGSPRKTPAGGDSWSFWHGPAVTRRGDLDRFPYLRSTVFSSLEANTQSVPTVAVFDSKVKARRAIDVGYGGNPSRLRIVTVAEARRITADSLENYATAILARVARLRGEV